MTTVPAKRPARGRPAPGDGHARLPRPRRGSPTSRMLTLFGDYWWGRAEPLPSAAIVALLADFGVSEAAARAALSRMVKHRLLEPSRSGRTTGYRLAPRAVAVMGDALARILAFGAEERAWDGTWSIVALDDGPLPRTLRDAVRSRLQWLGFARLVDGMWLSPWDRHAEALDELRALGVVDVTTFTARLPAASPGRARPEEAWDLAGLAADYRAFIADATRLRSALAGGRVDPARALVQRTELTDRWIALANSDPDLPVELLPAGWPRAEARALLIEAHEALGERAMERVKEAIRAVEPDRADLVMRRSFRG